MHSKPMARHALAALTAAAALVAVPAAATADQSQDGDPLATEVRAELDGLRRATEDTPSARREREAVRAVTDGRNLTAELKRLRRRIQERRAVEQPAGLLAKVLMPERLAVGTDGATRLRMTCTGDAVAACRGIVWLADETGDVVAHARFRIPAGEARRVKLKAREAELVQEERLVATAAVRDASDAVWTNSRRIAVAA